MSKADVHTLLPKDIIPCEIYTLRRHEICTYQDDVGQMWCISHNDSQYDIVAALLESYGE